MRAPSEPKFFISVALVGAVVAVGGLLYWEWGQGLLLEQSLLRLRKAPVTPVALQPALPEFVLPDAATGFPELTSRSPFVVSRRSPLAANKGGRSVMKKGQFTLVGVLVAPSQRSALLRDIQTNKTEAVAVGGAVRGMTLGEVEPTKVILRQGGESEELLLVVQTAAKVPGTGGLVAPTTNLTASPMLQPSSAASSATRNIPTPPSKPPEVGTPPVSSAPPPQLPPQKK